MENGELEREVARRHWFHTIEVGPGLKTKGHYEPIPGPLFDSFGIGRDLSGIRALDLGCADGAYAFELARRGAYVTAVDIFSADAQNVEFLSRVLGLPVAYERKTIYQLDGEPFDLVVALGVLYHLEHPLLGLQCLNRVARKTLLLESHIETSWRARGGRFAQFFPDRELNNDPSNWWAPTQECLFALVGSAGFEIREHRRHVPGRMILRAEKVKDVHPAFTPEDVFRRHFDKEPF